MILFCNCYYSLFYSLSKPKRYFITDGDGIEFRHGTFSDPLLTIAVNGNGHAARVSIIDSFDVNFITCMANEFSIPCSVDEIGFILFTWYLVFNQHTASIYSIGYLLAKVQVGAGHAGDG